MGEERWKFGYCSYCGKRLPEGAKFCTFCGGVVKQDGGQGDRQGNKQDETVEVKDSAENVEQEQDTVSDVEKAVEDSTENIVKDPEEKGSADQKADLKESVENIKNIAKENVTGKVSEVKDWFIKKKKMLLGILIAVIAVIVVICVAVGVHKHKGNNSGEELSVEDDSTASLEAHREALAEESEKDAEEEADNASKQLKSEYNNYISQAEDAYAEDFSNQPAKYFIALDYYSSALASEYEEFYAEDNTLDDVCDCFIESIPYMYDSYGGDDYGYYAFDKYEESLSNICSAIKWVTEDGYSVSDDVEEFYNKYNDAEWNLVAVSNTLQDGSVSWVEGTEYDEEGNLVKSPVNPYGMIGCNTLIPNYGSYSEEDPVFIGEDEYNTYYRYDQEDGIYDFSYGEGFKYTYVRVYETSDMYANINGVPFPTYIKVCHKTNDDYSEEFYRIGIKEIEYESSGGYTNTKITVTVTADNGTSNDNLTNINYYNTCWSFKVIETNSLDILIPYGYQETDLQFYSKIVSPYEDNYDEFMPYLSCYNWYNNLMTGSVYETRVSQTSFAYVYCNPAYLYDKDYEDLLEDDLYNNYLSLDPIGDERYNTDEYKDKSYRGDGSEQ